MYRDYLHARSVDYAPHPSRNRVCALHATIAHEIPENWRFCGEDSTPAQHRVRRAPRALPPVLDLDDRNECLSGTTPCCGRGLLGLHLVPVIRRGSGTNPSYASPTTSRQSRLGGDREGYVVRLAGSFHYRAFRRSVAKFVRKNHVQTDDHWTSLWFPTVCAKRRA